MPIELSKANICVTGATGFLGKHLVEALRGDGTNIFVPPGPRDEINGSDFTHYPAVQWVFDYMSRERPVDYVFHLAGYNGGIAFNQKCPADIFAINTIMGLNILKACQEFGVKKVVSVVASCAYPTSQSVCNEEAFLEGPPHDSVACHGYGKRNLQLASSFYRKQYGLQAVCACPTTLYGPGDSFDPERTKVMGAMIRRFAEAVKNGDRTVTCWGTGKPYRDFLYVKDAAKLLIQVMQHYDNSEIPLNLGFGQEVTVKELASRVAEAVGYNGDILWDVSKPDGQSRKRLDTSRMGSDVDLSEFTITPLNDGIKETVEWYLKNSL
jgi:nucleoside-diphosphate-sugar epimerase